MADDSTMPQDVKDMCREQIYGVTKRGARYIAIVRFDLEGKGPGAGNILDVL